MEDQTITVANPQSVLDAIFQPLDANASEIRLATLKPSQSGNDPLACTLEVVRLEDLPAYEAISWCWGDPNVTEPIELCGHTFDVPRNLAEALRCFRLRDNPRTLWVDALCINQGLSPQALQERAEQVQVSSGSWAPLALS